MKPKTCIVIICLNCLFYISCGLNPETGPCIAFESDYHIVKGCECVMYESTGRTEGTFFSPNFPHIYPSNINCILYTFLGGLGEIVELTFLEFDLQMRVTEQCSDYVSLYLDLERPEVNEAHRPKYQLCGGIISMDQHKFYSKHRSLILEFHSDSFQANNTGFRGRFHFRDQQDFDMSGGSKRWGSKCTYDFFSNEGSRNGRFFSPHYPQNYPADSLCFYNFFGVAELEERVKITFHNIQMETIVGRCEDSPDSITVLDGDQLGDPVIGRYCGTQNSEQIISSAEKLSIQFRSDSKNQRQGFSASFEFTHEDPTPYPNDPTSRNTDRISTSTKNVLHFPNSTESPTNCDHTFKSSEAKKGWFTSPNFPNDYNANSICKYRFRGWGRERVQIAFMTFDLYYPSSDPTNPSDCEQVDEVRVFLVGDLQHNNLLGAYCGRRRPPMLMSHNTLFDVIFTSQAHESRGFNATYEFVENFGIQDYTPEPDMPCLFRFESSRYRNGTFTSPNFPGLYPRYTECHYVFVGNAGEKVHITFPFFNVEGLLPHCEDDTSSDYVEFSNFDVNVVDRKMHRFCGLKESVVKRKEIVSDGKFFRVTFKSNHKYDATGFSAYFYFKREQEDGVTPSSRTSGNSCQLSAGTWTYVMLYLPVFFSHLALSS